jgi:hypothetical protein
MNICVRELVAGHKTRRYALTSVGKTIPSLNSVGRERITSQYIAVMARRVV